MATSNFTGPSKVMTGARAIFAKEGTPVAYAGGCDGTEEVMYEPVDVLNNLFVQEHAPVGYRCSLNAAVFRVPDASPKAQGIFPGMLNPADVLVAGGWQAYLKDAANGHMVALMEGCKPTSCNFSVTARGLMQDNMSFVGIRMLDVSEIP